MSNSKLVQSFNALPRKQKAPSGMVPNKWHFDLRYVHLQPPSFILVLIQPESAFLHQERLPIGFSGERNGIAFFPESAEAAAPEIAKALLQAFVQGICKIPEETRKATGSKQSTAFNLAPWSLTTEDKALAAAVGAEFKRLGVRHEALFRIDVSTESVNRIMQDSFETVFHGLKKAIGIQAEVAPFISTPTAIVFRELHPRPRPEVSAGTDGDFERALEYVQDRNKSRPPMEDEVDPRTSGAALWEEVQTLRNLIAEKPANAIKTEADAGDPEAAFDYGMRLLVGLGCDYDRTLARDYMIKALSSPKASDQLKCIAHGRLIDWYISAFTKQIPTRYLFAASHHANIAAALCRRLSPPGMRSSPAVLWFMSSMFEPHSNSVPELCYFFKDAWKAWEDRKAQVASEGQKLEEKRMKSPNQYRCATVGCGIEADMRKMLAQCAGKCDVDKKPHYCSKECQRADWKNHKPFCKPGMPCSVIDTGSNLRSAGGGGSSSKQGAIQIPITRPDGSKVLLSSSTINPKMLKEVRDYAGGDGGGCALALPESLAVEFSELDLHEVD